MKKIISMLLSLILCATMIGSASALSLTDDEIQQLRNQQEDLARASKYFATRGVWASAVGDGEVEIGFDLTCARVMNNLGATKVEVMRKSGNNWVSVKTYKYTDSGMEYLYQSDRGTISEDLYFQGTSGKDYFAYVTVKAEDDDGSETIIMSTNVVTAK